MILKRFLGDIGENAAVRYLKRHGYKIIERNFSCRFGEIDIIAKDKEYLVFIEVKLRKSNDFGGALGAITPSKIEKIRKTANLYIMKNPDIPVRFDVVAITGDAGKKIFKPDSIEVIKNAF